MNKGNANETGTIAKNWRRILCALAAVLLFIICGCGEKSQSLTRKKLIVATDATLDRAQCSRLAAQAQGALALAIAPVHTILDGDTVFVLSTGRAPAPDGLGGLLSLGVAAVESLRTAIERSVIVG